MLDLEPDGFGEHRFFQILSLPDEVFHGILMGDPGDVLRNDRALIQVGGDVVAGCPDDLHAPVECRMVGPGALEGRQE